MQQLKMIRKKAPASLRALPEGYTYEKYCMDEGQVEDWIAICRNGLIQPNDGREVFEQAILNYTDLVPCKDVTFVLDDNGDRVATTTSVLHSGGDGYIHMVAALPQTRGRGIGHAMLSYALCELEERGAQYIWLTTDDWRLAAIKTYLDAGFLPVIYHDPDSDMTERWNKVIEEIGYDKVEFLSE